MGRLTALNRPHELELHGHAAQGNGLAKEEMAKYCGRRRYCGIAAAKDSFSSRDEG
jgi:4-carboxymuconolactone decarboxylase